ncbi:class I SAM-dependent rRNA methyltransferase [Spirochaeta thermophila]|uniref:PUA domain-containing protein n=1 Tax=Winmispira thermophila (strain ATCC 49972 / DSM 6192 / RI 19.B1) TaxID=665571 RepID=E0RQV2_WINT6|nr:class I SAM-dependent rRNA methyltransferase [Spirochaeta thermophila]ADN03008.1 hypothetical protein STHERM_c20770 [Spirochaeta thermophila DSM 6192]
MMHPSVIIRSSRLDSIRRRHPWVFSGAVARTEGDPAPGDIVTLRSEEGHYLGIGTHEGGNIAVRILSFDEEEIDASFWHRRLEAAFARRRALGLTDSPETTAYRLVHGGGDDLPGLILDYYDGVVVFQTHSIGVHRHRESIVEALRTLYGHHLKAVYDKSRATLPPSYEMENGYLYRNGDLSLPWEIREHGLRFLVDWEEGQKTGFYLDQRDNRALVARLAEGRRVLNGFSYTGGFTLNALAGGAVHVTSVDRSDKALTLLERNLALNDLPSGRHTSICAEVLPYLKEHGHEYDLIILDPPAFAKHVQHRHKAIIAYKHLNKHALRTVRPGGIMITFSCSQVVELPHFVGAVRAAAIDVGRRVTIIGTLHQPPDHPVNIYQPESEYLKGLVLYVE